MRHDAFLERVSELADVSLPEAETATTAVLETLAERIGRKEALETAAQLPKELKGPLDPPEALPEIFDAAEFVRRVGERTGIDDDGELRRRIRAVFVTLQEAVSPGELADWQYDLTTDYVDLAARPAELGSKPRGAPPDSPHYGHVELGPHEFVKRVAERAGLDEQRARRAVEAVLETFGERIADGEARDLAVQLPDEFGEALTRPGGDPVKMPVDEFVHRVAEREGELDWLAREHVRAVLTTLREAVTVDEWDDTIAELPKEYDALVLA
jgi:uncharacterized protein (DUF2267 family)